MAAPATAQVSFVAVGDTADLPLERVEAELCTLAGQIAAATCRFLVLLGDFDARDGWAGWNVRSCAHWLTWRCSIDLRTAREYVRVARALRELPRTREVFTQGRVSCSKVRAISRVATPATESDLVDAALHAPASQVERLTRGLETVERIAVSDAAAARGDRPVREPTLRWPWDDDGTLVLWGRLPAEDGATLLAALARAKELNAERGPDGGARSDGSAEPSEPGTTEPVAETVPRDRGDVDPLPPSNAADALMVMAGITRDAVAAPRHAPVADVVVHVDVETLTGGEGGDAVARDGRCRTGGGAPPRAAGARLDDGPGLASSVARRLACDGRIRLAVHASDGRTLDLGRWRRRPTAAQKTALWQRDRGCAVPGCGRTRFLHAHHVRAWARGGRTSLDNMVLLCGERHRWLHDGAFSIVALGRQKFRLHGPAGATYSAVPGTRGSVDELVAAYPDVDPSTIEPDWGGFPLDLHYAVATYLDNWALAERKRARDARDESAR